MAKISRKLQTQKRHKRLRRYLIGSKVRPRLAVFRSNNHIYAQVIDDNAQQTICSASTVDKELKEDVKKLSPNCSSSSIVGKLLAKRAIKKGVKQVIFDRGGNLYHGRVKALADAARDEGLNF
ncbi:50S ribosomal protein L18 [Prochlorococcus sp. AH-716-K03]|nr:50S ribosomal protein L18 [Prochlorococcus sp. AH-716-K03]